MQKYEFLSAIEKDLSGLPKEDIRRSLDYYSEMIDDRMDEGLSEEDAIKEIGAPEEIAAQILSETSLPKLVKKKMSKKKEFKTWEIILLVLGAPLWIPLLLSLLIIILSIFAVIWSLIVSLYAINITFVACGIACVFFPVTFLINGAYWEAITVFGVGILLLGLGVFLFLGSKQVTKGVIALSKKTVIVIKNILVKG